MLSDAKIINMNRLCTELYINYLLQGGYVLTSVCLSICQQFYSKTTGQIFVNFCGIIRHYPGTSRLDFGGNPDLGPDAGIF